MFKPCCTVPIGITEPTGESDIITIRDTLTVNDGSQVFVTDTYDGRQLLTKFLTI